MFASRTDAGLQLAESLVAQRVSADLVLGLARGGMPVAVEVAQTLKLPLEVLVVRKLGAPNQPEYAIGALAEDGTVLLDQRVIAALGVGSDYLERIHAEQLQVLTQRVERFRAGRKPLNLQGRSVIIVDDGLATGLTARVACQFARKAGASHIVLAVPVAAQDTVNTITEADEVIALATPEPFYAVGGYYDDFTQVTDEQVQALLGDTDTRSSGTF